MFLDALCYAYIRYSTAISKNKVFIINILLYSLQAPSRLGTQPGINHSRFPILRTIIKYFNTTIGQVDYEVAIMTKIIDEVSFYNILFVVVTDNKLISSIMTIGLHNMPKSRLSTYFNRRFGDKIGNLTQAGSKVPYEDDYSHYSLRLTGRNKFLGRENHMLEHFLSHARIDSSPESIIQYKICTFQITDNMITFTVLSHLIKSRMFQQISRKKITGLYLLALQIFG